MKAVIYCRVSSEEQVQNLSLGTQEKACREHCERNGWEVGMVFVERGESAKTADRTQLQAALAHCRKERGAVDVFLVYAVDRFARHAGDHHALKGELAKWGIALRAVTQSVVGDDANPYSRFAETMLASVAQLDNDVRAGNTKRGMRAALEAGRWVWQPPLGYRAVYDQASGRHLGIAPDPDIAPLVVRAFRAVAFGARVNDVVAELQEHHLLGARGERVAHTTLHRILRNPIYKGRLVLPRWGIDREAAHEPLVDTATWARVQRRLSAPEDGQPRQVRPYRRANGDFPLGGGFCRCDHCTRPLIGSWSKGRSQLYPYYRCHGCRLVTARRERIHGEWLDLLCQLQPAAGVWADFAATVVQEFERAAGDRVAKVARAEARREALAARKRRLVDAYVYDRALPLDEYRERLAVLGREEDSIEVELTAAAADSPSIEGLLAFASRTLARPADLWLELGDRPDLQRVTAVAICPAGVTFDGDRIATAATHSIYSTLGTDGGLRAHLVPPTGRRSNRGAASPLDLTGLLGDLVDLQGALHGAL